MKRISQVYKDERGSPKKPWTFHISTYDETGVAQSVEFHRHLEESDARALRDSLLATGEVTPA